MTVIFKKIQSPLGQLKLYKQDNKLIAILWENETYRKDAIEDASDELLKSLETELADYFEGKRKTFSIPFKVKGTAFQEKVWQELLSLPYGTTTSYTDIAERIGNKKAVRAVGGAIGKNPIPLLIPCHRVIGSKGALTGFAGGLERKEMLLKVECIL